MEGGPNEKRSQELAMKLANFHVFRDSLEIIPSLSFCIDSAPCYPQNPSVKKQARGLERNQVPEKLVLPAAAWSLRTGRLQPFPWTLLASLSSRNSVHMAYHRRKSGVISPATHPTTKVISGNVLPKETWLSSHGKDMSRPIGHLSL